LLAHAVKCCPQAEVLWLMWVAREVLQRAFVRNSEREQIWLAVVKLEAENGELAVARELLVRARTVADIERVITIFLLLSANTGTHFLVYLFSRSG